MNRKLKVEELNRLSVEEFKKSEKFPVILVLENLRSLNNVGSAFRTADSLGIEEIFLVGYTPCPPHREINKTAIGAIESVKWSYFESPIEVYDELGKRGYSIFSIEQTEESEHLNKINWSKFDKIAIILGNEISGVEQQTIDMSVKTIEIPQFGTKHSLNVSVCAGIILWDILNKRFL